MAHQQISTWNSITGRLYVAIGLLLACFLLAIVQTNVLTHSVATGASAIALRSIDSIRAADAFDETLDEHRRALASVVGARDAAAIAGARERLAEIELGFASSLGPASRTLPPDLVAKLTSDIADLASLARAALGEAARVRTDAEASHVPDGYLVRTNEIEDDVSAWKARVREATAAELVRMSHHAKVMRRLCVFTTVGGSLFGVLALLLGRSVLRRLRKLSSSILSLAAGDLAAEVPFRGVDDEFGLLADALDTFRAAAERVAASEANFSAAFESMVEGIVLLSPDDVVILHNQRLVDLLGLADHACADMTSSRLLQHLSEQQKWPAEAISLFRTCLADARHQQGATSELVVVGPQSFNVTAAVLPNGSLLLSLEDISHHRAAAERIRKLAHHDLLTGLANRVLLHERVTEAIARSRRTGTGLAVLCLDLDGFKAVNDLHGHGTGDELLREVAARLGRSVRETDTVARLGGDEFVVLQADPGQPEAARMLAERLVSVLAEPYDLGSSGTQSVVTTSVGVALFPGDGSDPESLLRNADTALYRAKWAGKNGAAFFQPAMDYELRERRALERDLRQAAARGEFALAWQPLSSTGEHDQVTGFEVLLRWQRPEYGLMPPDQFIPAAEACGAITTIGAWVLREACREAARWTVPLQVAVNVSPVQAQQGEAFAEMVEQVLVSTGLAPSRLTLEVTEGVLIRDAERVLAALNRLKALGVRFALDDFGTGYSSLATLRAFPFDKLKIDRSFVAEIDGAVDGQGGVIVESVLGLARGMRLPVVAEGVETEAQLGALRAAGCEEVQGWLVGRPGPIGSFACLTRPAITASAA